MKVQKSSVINRARGVAWLVGLLLLLPAGARAQCLLQWYWPMNDGDNTTFTDSSLGGAGNASLSVSANGDGFILAQTTSGGTAYLYFSGSNNQWLLSEIYDPSVGDLIFDTPLIFLNEAILDNPGSVSSSSAGTIATAAGTAVNVTLAVSTTKAGTVTVPAGAYTNCLSLALNLTVSAAGNSARFPLSAFVLAPGVGAIKPALYSFAGTNSALTGWGVLTDGQVGGVSVASLAPASALTVPSFTLQPKATTATNLGIAILRAAAAGGSVQYQWQFNGSDLSDGGSISGSASSNLVINPVAFTNAGVYSVSIANPVCTGGVSTNAVLTVMADTSPPTLGITNMPAGLSVSNAVFTILGTASDSIAVAGVQFSINDSGWTNATATTPNWSSWSAQTTLAPGINIIQAQAEDTGGNLSKIATNQVYYVVSALLTVQTNQPGWGGISPNDNGKLLPIGGTNTLTATAASGFKFINWTNNFGFATNAAALTFLMQPNLVLTANFAETNPPTLNITTPAAHEVFSNSIATEATNSSFLVSGTAKDNVAVTQVNYRLNGGSWNPASGTSNWTGSVSLQLGTNSIQAYAQDAAGNHSVTSSVPVLYWVTAPLTVQTNQPGWGGISPNDNGKFLPIGSNYTLTATAATGFKFLNWTNNYGQRTNTATLTFPMQAGLVWTANFADTTPPTLSITSPAANSSVSNALLTMTGRSADNVGVTEVYYALNQGTWLTATQAGNWSNWTAQVTLTTTTNTLQAYAVDAAGNRSLTNKVTFDYVVSALLTVQTNGSGTVSPNYNGVSLQVGKTYSMTAKAGPGCVFTNWYSLNMFVLNVTEINYDVNPPTTFLVTSTNFTSGLLTTNPALSFEMSAPTILSSTFITNSNSTIITNSTLTEQFGYQANFLDVTRPVLAIVSPTTNQPISSNSFLIRGTATDNVAVASVWYQFNGGGWQNPTGTNNWSVAVGLNPGTNTIMACAVDTSGNVSLTNTVNFIYVSKAVLFVSTNGNGTVSPNDNGEALQIGENYSLTATAATGFKFLDWTSNYGPGTNAATLTFAMQSNLALTANFYQLPAIQTQPANALAFYAGAASFSVGARGTGPLTYQWQFNSANLSGQNGAALQLSALTASQAGNYRVIVNEYSSSVTSSVAKLTLTNAPADWAGLNTVVTPSTRPPFQISFGSNTFSEFSLDTNYADSAAGHYGYATNGALSGQLSLTNQQPPEAVANGPSVVNVTFVSPGVASFINPNDGSSGTIQYYTATNLVPAVWLDHKITLTATNPAATTVLSLTNASDFTATSFSPVAGWLQLYDASGTTNYLQLQFTTPTNGDFRLENYDQSGTPVSEQQGGFNWH